MASKDNAEILGTVESLASAGRFAACTALLDAATEINGKASDDIRTMKLICSILNYQQQRDWLKVLIPLQSRLLVTASGLPLRHGLCAVKVILQVFLYSRCWEYRVARLKRSNSTLGG
jgi:hypothetical protein